MNSAAAAEEAAKSPRMIRCLTFCLTRSALEVGTSSPSSAGVRGPLLLLAGSWAAAVVPPPAAEAVTPALEVLVLSVTVAVTSDVAGRRCGVRNGHERNSKVAFGMRRRAGTAPCLTFAV